MRRNLSQIRLLFIAEVTSHAIVYCILLLILALGIFVRTFRSFDLLQFYYDQGRDALQVQQILRGHLTLIGPTTGFEGIFRGPFYYYWLAPAYVIAHGNPGTAAAIEAAINSIGLLVLYMIGATFFSRKVGLMAAFLPSLSFYAVKSTRWLSNPAPVWLFGPFAYLFILFGLNRNWKWMPFGLFCLGLTLQMEEAGMGFVTIAVAIFCIIYSRRLKWWQWVVSIVAFLSTLIPLALFELRHQFLITHNVLKLLLGSNGEQSFAPPPQIGKILGYFSGEFGKELFLNGTLANFHGWSGLAFVMLLVGVILTLYTYRKSLAVQLAILWLIIPIIFMFYYKKDLFEYYFFGLYPIFFLLVAVSVMQWTRWKAGWLIVGLFAAIVLYLNVGLLHSYLLSHVEKDKNTIVLENQWQAIDYIFQTAGNQKLNVNVYVPPVIPYTYDYLIPYYAKIHGRQLQLVGLSDAQVFYTLHELDTDHPQFEQAWLIEQNKRGQITIKERFGGIFVEKRQIAR